MPKVKIDAPLSILPILRVFVEPQVGQVIVGVVDIKVYRLTQLKRTRSKYLPQ